ncbi:Tissue factor [Labeo rohita]|uniref:Tissue factor n=1 Tax=Labeo rohita TaxID=84645 RepID=A0ABQ8LDS4_LABRO|nr:Tissue factor [Labeo rohita]
MESNRQMKFRMLELLLVLFFMKECASEIYPKAQNVTWFSINFKSMLTWSPKPTNYSYTVEFSKLGQDRERTPHCIRTMDTECDLTLELKNLQDYYTADILSEPMRGVSSDLVEFPHVSSKKFSPYHDTDIGGPEFNIEVSSDKRKTTLHVTDVPTALFDVDKNRLNIRDVFGDKLQYKVIYRKAKSTGKAFLPFRALDKQLGQLSQVQCSPEEDTSIFGEYSVGVIAGAILIIILAITAIIIVIVMCCRRRRRAENTEKEGLPLNGV